MTYKIKARDYVKVRPNDLGGNVFEVVRFSSGDPSMVRIVQVDNDERMLWEHVSRLTLFAEYLADCSCGCPVYTRVGVQHIDECRSNDGNGEANPRGLGVEPEPRTEAADYVLADELNFGRRIRYGMLTASGQQLTVDKLSDENRDHLRAYAEWLLRVAERAS